MSSRATHQPVVAHSPQFRWLPPLLVIRVLVAAVCPIVVCWKLVLWVRSRSKLAAFYSLLEKALVNSSAVFQWHIEDGNNNGTVTLALAVLLALSIANLLWAISDLISTLRAIRSNDVSRNRLCWKNFMINALSLLLRIAIASLLIYIVANLKDIYDAINDELFAAVGHAKQSAMEPYEMLKKNARCCGVISELPSSGNPDPKPPSDWTNESCVGYTDCPQDNQKFQTACSCSNRLTSSSFSELDSCLSALAVFYTAEIPIFILVDLCTYMYTCLYVQPTKQPHTERIRNCSGSEVDNDDTTEGLVKHDNPAACEGNDNITETSFSSTNATET